MISDKDLDLLDNYLTNKLSGEEQVDFEKIISANSELQKELKLQKQIVEGLKNARAIELKKSLNKIPIGNGSQALKIAAALSVGVVFGVLLYFVWPQDTPQELTVTNPELKEENTVLEQKDVGSASVLKPIAQAKEKTKKQQTTTPQGINKNKKIKNDLTIDVFDPSVDNESSNSEVSVFEDEEIDKVTSNSSYLPVLVEINSDSRKLSFHYQFSNNKLILYGPFEHNLYEILEFISDDKRMIYLYYKDKYYYITETVEIKDLVTVKNEDTLKKLKDYQANN